VILLIFLDVSSLALWILGGILAIVFFGWIFGPGVLRCVVSSGRFGRRNEGNNLERLDSYNDPSSVIDEGEDGESYYGDGFVSNREATAMQYSGSVSSRRHTRARNRNGVRRHQLDTLCPVSMYEGDKFEIISCAVCLDEFEQDVEIRTLPCSHFYHNECIRTWLTRHKTCPLCNANVLEFERKNSEALYGSHPSEFSSVAVVLMDEANDEEMNGIENESEVRTERVHSNEVQNQSYSRSDPAIDSVDNFRTDRAIPNSSERSSSLPDGIV